MAAYLHANIQVLDLGKYDEYRKQVAATIAAYGGQFLVRGGAAERLEGDGEIHRQVILQFPDMAALKAWYHSDAYKPLIALRQSAARGTLVAVEGVPA
jgi:uncharacterized protein (DUF1330 family)